MLTFIGQGVEYIHGEVTLQPYKTLIKPHLEYLVRNEGSGGFGEVHVDVA